MNVKSIITACSLTSSATSLTVCIIKSNNFSSCWWFLPIFWHCCSTFIWQFFETISIEECLSHHFSLNCYTECYCGFLALPKNRLYVQEEIDVQKPEEKHKASSKKYWATIWYWWMWSSSRNPKHQKSTQIVNII